jgi:deoxyribose-phosphate aldolase
MPDGIGTDLGLRIDHTILKPEATAGDVFRVSHEAVHYGFRVVFVPACYAEVVCRALAGTGVQVGIPVGFPLGGQTTTAKVHEAVDGVSRGATILDLVINVSCLKSGDYDRVRDDIAEVVAATPDMEHKVILETCYLTREEKLIACRLALEAGAQYVKTSTGFGPGGATVEDVVLLKHAVGEKAKVKASGGIRDLKTAVAMLEAGADRIGTSAGAAIMEEWLARRQVDRGF